jgi:hypothetical protein
MREISWLAEDLLASEEGLLQGVKFYKSGVARLRLARVQKYSCNFVCARGFIAGGVLKDFG